MIFKKTIVLVDTRKVPREKNSSDYTDHELILEALSGNDQAYPVLMERYQYQIFVYILRILNFQKENADEVSAETWIKLYQNLKNYNPEHSFKSWAYRIAHNCCIDFIRKNKKYSTLPITEANQNNWSTTIDFDKPDIDSIEKALSKLKPDERNLIIMFYIQSLTLDEISSKLVIPKKTLSVKLCRIRKKAQSFFGDQL
jgi:RNA polymerase sigma factor (sigma-70 family)